ncbi:MAG: exodeoxyribonuclease III [Actinobacteria bacterium]|nr:exodeoxyribonuclease III [Actinomycetota bacterium]
MLIATWNVNSVRARMERVLEFLEVHQPDALLLQETKVAQEQFPFLELAAAGYQAVDHSTGRWAGVAILVPDDVEVTAPVRGLAGEPLPGEARWVEATVRGIRLVSVYVPNGRSLLDPSFPDKLVFLDAMRDRIAALAAAGPLLLGGDLNVAPTDADVWDPRRFVGTTHTSPEERSRLQAMLDAGVVDLHRHVVERGSEREGDEPGFTWWDYRAGAFHRNLGMRIDLFLATPDVAARARRCGIDRDFRKGAKPSDHAPLIVAL